jgi:L,D-peptidoglycan transpeptidase YkuD (ErfK/YbiS/YcfS/YnhG family)
VLLAGCGGSSGKPAALPSPTVSPSAVASPTASPTPRPTLTHTASPAAKQTTASTQHPTPKPAPLLVTRLNGVGSAQQVISVVASSYGTSSATLQAFEKTGSTWHRVFGPWSAHIGRAGFAPSGDKREGDLRTPSGSYGFQYMFGVRSNPGVRYDWRPVRGSYDVWDDDSSSARYNLWTDKRYDDPGSNPEPMYNVPAYNYGAVIAYNTARTPHMGSAIFFHVSTGGGTAGCVSLPTSELLDVLRWMNPSKGARIIMGTESAVT